MTEAEEAMASEAAAPPKGEPPAPLNPGGTTVVKRYAFAGQGISLNL